MVFKITNNKTLRTITFFTDDILLKAKLPRGAFVHLLQCNIELVHDILPYKKSRYM